MIYANDDFLDDLDFGSPESFDFNNTNNLLKEDSKDIPSMKIIQMI